MKTTPSFQLDSSPTNTLALAVISMSLLLPSVLHAASQKFTASGTFTPAAGITSVTVECWGGGGAGGSAERTASGTVITAGGGAGGGAYAKKVNIPVTPGTPYTVTIPAAATAPASGFATGDRVNGADITFTGDGGASVTASGGEGGACAVDIAGSATRLGVGGAAGAGLDAAFAGGSGQSATTGGIGGSAASDLSNGSQGSTATKTGSDADHNGGGGGTGVTGSNNGGPGATPGGGGGGGRRQTTGIGRGGAGGKGQMIITYIGATATKADNALALSDPNSWVGSNAPDSTATAKWDNTVNSANTTGLGADLAWGSINIANPNGLVTINAGNILTLSGGIDMSAAAADLTLNCELALAGPTIWNVAGSRALTLGGIVSGAFNLTKQGDGKAVMSATNTYSGATAINGGTLQLGASDVIPNGTGKDNVSVAASCALDLNSFSETINGLSGAGTVDNSAAGTVSTLTVGSNNADSALSGIIQNSGLLSTTNLVKSGSGTLTLSGVNTFTGTTTVNGGNLTLANANPLGNISGLTIGAASLGYSANNAVIAAPVTLDGNLSVIVQSNGILANLNGVIGGTGNITFATGSNTLSGDNRVSLGAASDFVGNVTITTTSSQVTNNMTLRLGVVNALPTTAVVTLDGQNGNGSSWCDLDLFGFNQTLEGLKNTVRTTRLQRVYNSSTTAATLTINNAADYTFGGALGKASGNNFGLIKGGIGTFTLSGANTYAGNTTVSDGILALADGAQLGFVLGANSGENNSLTGAGAVTLDGDFVIDTSAADALTSGIWTLENVSTLSGAYGDTFTVVGFVDAGSNKWTKDNGPTTYTFDETTGVLTLAATPGGGNAFSDWLTANPPATGFSTDSDNDGTSNGVENVLGTNPNAYSAGLTEVSSTATSVTFKHKLNPTIASDVTYGYKWSTNLAEWKAHNETNTGGTSATIVASPPDGNNVVTVVITITGGPNAKVFGRLEALQAP